MRGLSTWALAALVLVGAAAWGDQKNDRHAATAELFGIYTIVAGERNGQPIPAERLKGFSVRIAANAITTLDKDSKEVYVATYELDAARKPWRITMTATVTPVNGKGTKAQGLVGQEGDTVKLIYALPDGEAPTAFKTAGKQQMFVLKKTGK